MTRSPIRLAAGASAAAAAMTIAIALATAWLGDSRATPTASPTASGGALCTPPRGPLPSVLASDPCPSAILAVELAVAIVRLPIDRTVIASGSFTCGVLWPGVQSAPACYEPATRPGQYMHAWVSFEGSERVAVVLLGLDLPDTLDAPGATRPPWRTTVLAVEVPPIGWVLP